MRESRQFMSMGTKAVQLNLNRLTAGDLKANPDAISRTQTTEINCDQHEAKQPEGHHLSPRKSEPSNFMHNCLQESFEKELSRVKKTAEYNDTSSLFSNNTDNDSTIKFISILDKINENQIKKNKFYSEIIKDIDLEHQNHSNQLGQAHAKLKDEYFELPSFDDSIKGMPKSARNQLALKETGSEDSEILDRDRLYHEKIKGSKLAELKTSNSGNHIEHILEVHQPNQHEIIFECSKEWTVNQTPDMREKELMPAHLALHFERLRQSTFHENLESSPQIKALVEESTAPSKIYRLNCQKELFQSSQNEL